MRGSVILRVLFALILIAGLVGIGAFIYNSGVARGLASGDRITAPEGQLAPHPYYYGPFYRPWGWGFGLFGLFFPLLFVFLFFLAVRGLFFRGWRRYDSWKWHGWGERGQRDIPPMVEEWHRRMHEAGEEPTARQE